MGEMIEVARSSVQTWECDQMGHMNVQFYVAKAEEGMAALATALGLGHHVQRENGTVLVAREHHIRFLRELRPEDLSGSAGDYRLRTEIQHRVNLVIAPAKVNAVLIEDMLQT